MTDTDTLSIDEQPLYSQGTTEDGWEWEIRTWQPRSEVTGTSDALLRKRPIGGKEWEQQAAYSLGGLLAEVAGFDPDGLLHAARRFLEDDGWRIQVNAHGVRLVAVKEDCRRTIVAHPTQPEEPNRSTELKRELGGATVFAWRGEALFHVLPASDCLPLLEVKGFLQEHGVPVLWVEDGRVVDHWNYPPVQTG